MIISLVPRKTLDFFGGKKEDLYWSDTNISVLGLVENQYILVRSHH